MRPYFRSFPPFFGPKECDINFVKQNPRFYYLCSGCWLDFMNLLLDISKHPPWGSLLWTYNLTEQVQNLVRKTFHSEEAKKTKVENYPFGVLLLEYVISVNVQTVDSLFVAIFTAQTLNQNQQVKSKFLHLLSKAVCYYFEYMLRKDLKRHIRYTIWSLHWQLWT